jgi:serine/threonine protein kinase
MERASIGRYRVVGKLGKGGMGRVIRAVDEGLVREVAIKLPNDSEPDDIRRLQQECDVLMQLQHHNIVQVYGSGNEPDLPFYLVMEFVDGVTVEQMLRRRGGPLEPRQALKIALAVAEALAYAHRPPLRVIHRDIKPSNVLIRASDGAVKVTDFGIAAVLAERSGRTVIGTPDYMPPEQAMGQGADERSDLYSGRDAL